MEAGRELHITIDSTHGDVELVDGCLEIYDNRRSAIATEYAV
jgi:hypothetical protein